jgi:hypothetical protein
MLNYIFVKRSFCFGGVMSSWSLSCTRAEYMSRVSVYRPGGETILSSSSCNLLIEDQDPETDPRTPRTHPSPLVDSNRRPVVTWLLYHHAAFLCVIYVDTFFLSTQSFSLICYVINWFSWQVLLLPCFPLFCLFDSWVASPLDSFWKVYRCQWLTTSQLQGISPPVWFKCMKSISLH